ncbi:leucine-rich repeat extensin-like protein 5 [Helianthus annuus]|uniref:leucine-rich repeat extensin-like protein 5 n=1 Tax=Helianthus annuus TaxID=4232 RepID=UPI001652F67B|nr:leucine-rich repeat extensin-like protein 5 [Helianthus annuus]
MPPRVRGRSGRGKAPMRGRHDHEAGPSHRRTPSATFSSDSHPDWRNYLEPTRRSISLSSSPSYDNSFGPQQEDEPHDSHHSCIPLQRSDFHHSFQNPTPYFHSRFKMKQIDEPMGHNPLGPADHYPEFQDMDVDNDPDPEMPPFGTPTHPIKISSGSAFHGSPYRGPDIWVKRWGSYKWEFTPPHHNSPLHQQVPSEDPHFQAVTPPPPPPRAPEQPPPPEPSRRRRSAWISVQGGFHFRTPQHSSNYPPIFEDPQLGGPSNAISEVDSAPVAPAPPPMGYENPIPAYPDVAGYNPFEPQAYSGYNYNHAPAVDPYIEAANFNALYPSPFPPAYPTGYPAYGYQYPPPPQPQ